MRLIKVLFIVLIPCSVFSQADCFTIDKETNLAYNKSDSTLYTGTCSDYYRNGKLKFICQFENGIIQKSIDWSKDGVMLDSIIYLSGYKHYSEYKYYSNGGIKFTGTFQYSKTDVLNMDYFNCVGTHVNYKENGNKVNETTYIENSNLIYLVDYYENGNVRSNGYYYDENNSVKRDSVHQNFIKDGTLESEIHYSLNKEHGESKYYYKNQKIKEIRTFENGKFVNPAIFWDEEGRKYKIEYVIEFGQPTSIKSKEIAQ